MKRMAPQVGLESAGKRKFNNIESTADYVSTQKAAVNLLMDRKQIAEFGARVRGQGSIDHRLRTRSKQAKEGLPRRRGRPDGSFP